MAEGREPQRLVDRRADLASLDPLEPLHVAVPRRRGIEHAPAPQRGPCAEYHGVAARRHDGLCQAELGVTLSAPDDSSVHLRRAVMHLEARAVTGRPFDEGVEGKIERKWYCRRLCNAGEDARED